MFKKDNVLIGIGMALAVFSLGFIDIRKALNSVGIQPGDMLVENYLLLLIGLNAVLMRFILVNRKQNKTGSGILFTTFVFTIGYFISFYTDWFQ